MTNYQQAKQQLKELAQKAKEQFKTDKPAIRQYINDNAYYISQNFDLTEYQTDLLHNYACKLHP